MSISGKTKKLVKRYKFMLIGILAVIFLYVGVAGTVSATAQWWVGTGDTVHHVDYIWRLHNGDIPKRTDGIQYPPFVKLGGQKPQIESANPPLFYALQAPLIGPLLNQDHWEKAIAVGRAINIFIGVICIIVLAWAGWLFGGRRREMFAVAVPALSVMTYRFTRLNLDYSVDALLLVFSTLSIIFIYKLLQNGLQKKYLAVLTLLSVAGMATKGPYIMFLGVTLLAIILASVVHGKKSTVKNILSGSAISAAILVITLICIGWFYYFWNYKVYGNWFTARPPEYRGNREVKSFHEVITSTSLWFIFYTGYAKAIAVSAAITSFATAGILIVKKSGIKKLLSDKPLHLTALLMALATIGIFATQIQHAVGIGAYNFRYMLPAMLPIALLMTYGLLEFKRARGQLVALAAAAAGYTSILAVASSSTLADRVSGFESADGNVNKLLTATSSNGLSDSILYILLGLCAIGAILLSVSLFRLSRSDR